MKKNFIGYYILASALLWGIAIVASALLLKGTECFQKIAIILNSAAGIHLILLWGPLAAQIKKMKNEYEKELKEK